MKINMHETAKVIKQMKYGVHERHYSVVTMLTQEYLFPHVMTKCIKNEIFGFMKL